MKDFYSRLKDLRLSRGLSQKQVGEATGTSERTIQNYELRLRHPTIEVCIDIANYFNVSLDYLAGLTDNERGVK